MLKIGFTYRREYYNSILKHKEKIDFLEIIPDELNFIEHQDILMEAKKLREILPFTAHSTDLSIASENDREFYPRFDEIYKVLKYLEIKEYSDHLAFTRTKNLNCDAYLPPLYTELDTNTISEKIIYINNKLKTIDAKFSLENVANTVLADPSKIELEGKYMKALVDKADFSYILNIDSLLISARRLNLDPIDLLKTYPVGRIKSLTLVPTGAMNINLERRFGKIVENSALQLISEILRMTSPERIVIQVRYHNNTLDTQIRLIEEIKNIQQEAICV